MCSPRWGCGRSKPALAVLYVILFNSRIQNSVKLLNFNVYEGINVSADNMLIWVVNKKETGQINR
jgi:hypothetical protein